jgi:hypothetical protein
MHGRRQRRALRTSLRLFIAATTFIVAARAATPVLAMEPLNFNGLTIGEPSSRTAVESLDGMKCAPSVAQMMVCKGHTMIAGRGGNAHIVIADGILTRVSVGFPPATFNNIVDGLVSKLGKPTTDTRTTVENRMGGTFENRTVAWRDGRGNLLRVSRYGISIDEGSYMLVTLSDLERFGDGNK